MKKNNNNKKVRENKKSAFSWCVLDKNESKREGGCDGGATAGGWLQDKAVALTTEDQLAGV